MLKLAAAVVAIALADYINPSLIGGELFVATGKHPRHQTIAFTVAAWIVTFVFGLALVLGLGDLILALVPKPGRTVKYGLIAAAGVVLVVGGAAVWIRRRSLVSTEASNDRHDPHRPAALMGAGIAAETEGELRHFCGCTVQIIRIARYTACRSSFCECVGFGAGECSFTQIAAHSIRATLNLGDLSCAISHLRDRDEKTQEKLARR